MVRPFQGFMAEDGNTFDTEKEAEAYEAAFNLHKIIREQELVANLDTLTQNYIITEVVKFISENKSTVARYIEAGSNPQTIQYQPDIFDHARDTLAGLSKDDTGGSGEAQPEAD